jgi:hypothetical protein
VNGIHSWMQQHLSTIPYQGLPEYYINKLWINTAWYCTLRHHHPVVCVKARSIALSEHLSTECFLVLPGLMYSTLLFLKVIHYLPTSPSSSRHFYPCLFPSTTHFRRQSLYKMWPIQLAFLIFIHHMKLAIPNVLFS